MMQTWLPRKLRVLRAERGLTLRDAERVTGVDKDTLSKIERGKRHPHDVTLAKIAQGYGLPIEELMEETSPPKAEAPSSSRPVEEEKRREELEVDVQEKTVRIVQFDHAARNYRISWRNYLDALAERWETRVEEEAFTLDAVTEFFSNLMDMSQNVSTALKAEMQVTEALVDHAVKRGKSTELRAIREDLELTGVTYAARRLRYVADTLYFIARQRFEETQLEDAKHNYEEALAVLPV